jgi:adenosyl cobinamide kinase/adenosyl cobinamide phosphate guanylyltransferase
MLEVLKYTIPALVVLLATWLATEKQMKNEAARRNFELRKQSQKTITAVRLQAYERFTLLLERLEPSRMLLRLDISALNCQQLQQQLLEVIRKEFDHNLSQQIYVSDEVWTNIVFAKEEMLRFVNTCAQQFAATDDAMMMAKLLVTSYTSNGETPTQRALEALKTEVRTLM